MSQDNLRKNKVATEVILQHSYEHLRIEYYGECCRVVGHDAFIKADCFSAKGNHKFRVKIEIESIPDNELPAPRQFVDNFDENCASCQSNVAHYQHWYYAPLDTSLNLRRRL